ncbi:MAG: HEPN domain-containing protein [Candidatus Poribacteria bacterium]|nr:HEPN domain-containing protein [Candidatus Poribacteria bacterium]
MYRRYTLQKAIDRWIESYTYQTPEGRIIDLVIAIEALCLPDIGESTFKFGVRAAWYLGEDRKKLLAEFKELYKCRSAVVHGGELKKSVTIEEKPLPIFDFITQSQNRCRESINKIMQQCLEEEEFPKNDYWDTLVLG